MHAIHSIRATAYSSSQRSLGVRSPSNPTYIGWQRLTLWAVVGTCLIFTATGPATPAVAAPKSRPPWTNSRVRGTPDPPAPYRLVEAFPRLQFDNPICLVETPDGERMFVGELGGRVFSFAAETNAGKPDLVINLADLVPAPADDSPPSATLFGIALDPYYEANRFIYVTYVAGGPDPQTRLSRLTLTVGTPRQVEQDSEWIILTWPARGHNGGCLRFGTDGYLYISTGDGAGPNPPDPIGDAQNLSNLFGAILRVNVHGAEAPTSYAIPPDNPFINVPAARPEIWAYGLRNPWRFAVDRQSGKVWIGDNGWETWELIHAARSGSNHGWPIMEGRLPLLTHLKRGPTPIIPPVKDISHTLANSVIGGPVYRGKKHTELDGWFIHGDYIIGKIWALDTEHEGHPHRLLVDTDQRIVDFMETADGDILVLDHDYSGKIYKLIPSSPVEDLQAFPTKLSDTGLFDSVSDLEPAAGVVPYSVKVPQWMDGAIAQQWVAIPGGASIKTGSRHDDPFEFPDGTVLVKTLSLPIASHDAGESAGQSAGKGEEAGSDHANQRILLESQLLHYENGSWRTYTYLWNSKGTDADLVGAAGASRAIRVPDGAATDGYSERTWRAVSHTECQLCHNASANVAIGFVSEQLNHAEGVTTNQFEALAAIGVLDRIPDESDDDPPPLVDPHDDTQDLNDRARSYLHVNCGMCHHPHGGGTVNVYLRRHLALDETRTLRKPGVGDFRVQDPQVLVPGEPYRSLLFYRVAKLGNGRMPYIGSTEVDRRAVLLLHDWIRSLGNESDTTASVDDERASAIELLSSRLAVPIESRDQTIRQLLGSTEGALSLAHRIHAGSVQGEVRRRAIEFSQQSPTTDVRGLFEPFLPESQRRVRLGPSIDPQQILTLEGDAARGKLIFTSDTSRCRACHPVAGEATPLGPDVKDLTKQYTRAELLDQILTPSAKMDPKFVPYTLVNTAGQVYIGLLAERSETEVVLEIADRKTIRVPTDEIDEFEKRDQSLMPDLLLADMTAQEAADLLAYLMSLR